MSIQRIMQQSKDLILEHGVHPPAMFVDFASDHIGKQIFLDNIPEDLDMFHKTMFMLGRDKAEQLPDEDLASLCFVAEVNGVRIEVEDEPKVTDRRECLLFQYLAVLPPDPGESKKNLELSLHFVELIRDGQGKLIDLLTDDKSALTSAYQVLPPTAFLAGWSSARMSEEMQGKIIAKAKRATRKQRIKESWG